MDINPALENILPALKPVSRKELAGACPVCGGKDRFRFWPSEGETGRWFCRGCDKAGDGIQLLREIGGLSFKDACKVLRVERKIRAHRRPSASSSKFVPKASFLPGDSWTRMAANVIDGANGNPEPIITRGLKLETIQALRLGYWPVDAWYPREVWGLEPQINPETGKPRKVWVPTGIVIPHFKDGVPVRLKIRRPSGEPKYVMIPGSSTASVVLAGESGKPFVIVEGEIDALLLYQEARDIAAVIALGTCKAKPDMETMLLLKAAPAILISLDSDAAGATAWPWWRDNFPQAIRWPVPAGKDPGEAIQAGLDLNAWVKVGLELAGAVPVAPLPARRTTKKKATDASYRATDASILAPLLNEDTPGPKPCDRKPGLPCHGSEDTCFSRPYWDLKTFDEHNVRRKAAGLAACPNAERVERYIVELYQNG